MTGNNPEGRGPGAALAEVEETSVRLPRSAEMPAWIVLILMAIMAAI